MRTRTSRDRLAFLLQAGREASPDFAGVDIHEVLGDFLRDGIAHVGAEAGAEVPEKAGRRRDDEALIGATAPVLLQFVGQFAREVFRFVLFGSNFLLAPVPAVPLAIDGASSITLGKVGGGGASRVMIDRVKFTDSSDSALGFKEPSLVAVCNDYPNF